MKTNSELESIAEDEIACLTKRLPSEIRAALQDLPVHLEALPDPEITEELGEDLLGLFSGEVVNERGETLLPTPPRIYLYLQNIWEEAEHDADRYREEIRITLLHELGHYLGWDEEDMERHGLA